MSALRQDGSVQYDDEARPDSVGLGSNGPSALGLRAARVLNVVVAAIGLIVLSPVMVLVALAVKVTSRGPVFYTQTRVGLDTRKRGRSGRPHAANGDGPQRVNDVGGRLFRIYKFRTMVVDAEAQTSAVWASKNDPRVTRVGQVLRQYRLDELPQLLNVLRGDMNVVGPRPERPEIFAQLREVVSDYELRQQALPGITGHAQTNQEYDTSIESVRTKVAYDLEYIKNRGFFEDLKIMIRTIPVVFFRRGGW